jgi:hypothetical protein
MSGLPISSNQALHSNFGLRSNLAGGMIPFNDEPEKEFYFLINRMWYAN